jgi:outer membrane receptor protein involved in Fe transport
VIGSWHAATLTRQLLRLAAVANDRVHRELGRPRKPKAFHRLDAGHQAHKRTFGSEDNSFEIDGYTLVDAAASWRRGPIRVPLSARNLLNQKYCFDVSSESVDRGPPRQVLLSTSIRLQ